MKNKKVKILVVDDEQEVVAALRRFLSLRNYEVIGAFSGEEALSILEKEKTDLILLDIVMPGIGGGETARIIKDKYPDIKLIVVTGNSNAAKKLADDNLLEDTLIKPIDVQELYTKVVQVAKKVKEPNLALKQKQKIKKRIISIEAKLFFLEPSLRIYNFLSSYFRDLSFQGRNYQLCMVDNEESVMEKSAEFCPDIFIVNVTAFRKNSPDAFAQIFKEEAGSKEIILYNIANTKSLKPGVVMLAERVETACLKNGFMRIRWLEI